MPTFMIVPTEDAERLERRAKDNFDPADLFVLPEKHACIVKFDGTSRELADKLDLEGTNNKEDRPCPAVIAFVTTYGGYAPAALWEWLITRNGR